MLDRRGLMGGALGAAIGFNWVGGEAKASPSSVEIDEITLYRKLHLRTDDGLIFWWLQGPKIGQVGTTLTPLYTSSW